MAGALYLAGCTIVGCGFALGILATRRENGRLAAAAFVAIVAGVALACTGLDL